MQFHQYEDKEIQYLCEFLVKFDIPLPHQTKKKLNNKQFLYYHRHWNQTFYGIYLKKPYG